MKLKLLCESESINCIFSVLVAGINFSSCKYSLILEVFSKHQYRYFSPDSVRGLLLAQTIDNVTFPPIPAITKTTTTTKLYSFFNNLHEF